MKILLLLLIISMAACHQAQNENAARVPHVDTTSKCDRTLAGYDAYCVTAFWEENKVRIIRLNDNGYDTIWLVKPDIK